ncbi:MAG: response regulator [Candidatus Binatia bacterium]
MSPYEKKVLLVENHGDTAQLIRQQLNHIGYKTVLIADNGPDALGKVYEEKPDLILMDIALPGMSGIEITRKLKGDSRTRSIPILAVTGQAMPGDRERCLQNGCDGYLAKPFLHHDLKVEIEKLLAETITPANKNSA